MKRIFLAVMALALATSVLVGAQISHGPISKGSTFPFVTIFNGGNLEYGGCAWVSNVFQCGTTTNGGSARHTRLIAPGSGASILFSIAGTDYWQLTGSTGAAPIGAFVSAGSSNIIAPAVGADATNVDLGDVNRVRQQYTITPATGGATNCGPAFLAAATTADCTIATLKAGEKLVGIYADVTTGLTCSGTCTGTKTIGIGKTAGGTEFLTSGLSVVTTATQFGLVDADLGTAMTRAAAIQGGTIQSWTATTPVIVRFTSGTGNWGNAATTFVNAGSVKFTIIVEQVK